MNGRPPWRVLARHTRFSPVFVLGHVRSGTSLMCRLLLDHLGVNFGTESQFIVRYHQKLQRYGDLADDGNLRRLLHDISQERFFFRTRQNFGFALDVERAARAVGPERTYSNVLRAIFGQFAETQGHVRWGDKTPRYSLHLPVDLRSVSRRAVHPRRTRRTGRHAVALQDGFRSEDGVRGGARVA